MTSRTICSLPLSLPVSREKAYFTYLDILPRHGLSLVLFSLQRLWPNQNACPDPLSPTSPTTITYSNVCSLHMGWSSASHSIWTPKPLRWFPLKSSNVRFSFLLRTEVRSSTAWNGILLAYGELGIQKEMFTPSFRSWHFHFMQLSRAQRTRVSVNLPQRLWLAGGCFGPSWRAAACFHPWALALSSGLSRCPLVCSELHECWQHSPVRWQVHSLPGSTR